MKSELDKQLQQGLIAGKHPQVLARDIRKAFNVSRSDAERLMRTELARVQTDAQMRSFEGNGFEWYMFLSLGSRACEVCRALNGKKFKVKDMLISENAPPMHPNCRCSTAAAMGDEEKYSQQFDSHSEHRMSFREWRNVNGENESSNKQYKYRETVVKKNIINSASYRSKFNNVSDDASINRTAYARAKEMLKHRSGTKYEDIRESFVSGEPLGTFFAFRVSC